MPFAMVTVKGEADKHKEPFPLAHFVTLCHSMVLYLSNATLQLAVVHLEVDRHRIFVFLQRILDQRARCVRTSLPSSQGEEKVRKGGKC